MEARAANLNAHIHAQPNAQMCYTEQCMHWYQHVDAPACSSTSNNMRISMLRMVEMVHRQILFDAVLHDGALTC